MLGVLLAVSLAQQNTVSGGKAGGLEKLKLPELSAVLVDMV